MDYKILKDKLIAENYIVEENLDSNQFNVCTSNFPMFRLFISKDNIPYVYFVVGGKDYIHWANGVCTDINILISSLSFILFNRSLHETKAIYSIGFIEDTVEYTIFSPNTFKNDISNIDELFSFIKLMLFTIPSMVMHVCSLHTNKKYITNNFIEYNEAENIFIEKVNKITSAKNSEFYLMSRKFFDYDFYYNCKTSIAIYKFAYNIFENLNLGIKNNFLKSDEGLFVKVDLEDEKYELFIKQKIYLKINKILKQFDLKFSEMDVNVICNLNFIFVLAKDLLIVFPINENNFFNYELAKINLEEKRREEDKFFNSKLIIRLNDHISGNRFEELIYDILSKFHDFDEIRFVGSTNEPDGGRDILCRKLISFENEMIQELKVIVQCKSLNRSISKRDVNDLRDLLEFYNADGYILFSKQNVTVQLIDHLEKLRERKTFSIQWYTGKEIVEYMKMSNLLLSKYNDIITIVK